MQDSVSAQWIRVVGLVASLSIVWAMFRIHDFPLAGFVWASLAISASLWVRNSSSRSIRQVIDDVEAEPVRVAMAVRKPVS